MSADVIMPALGMAQEMGILMRWLKQEGDLVTKGEPIMEVETDKATVEIEAPGSGRLERVTAKEGDEVPVGQVIAVILSDSEEASTTMARVTHPQEISPLAQRIAQEKGVDLAQVKPAGGRITKEDVLAYVERAGTAAAPVAAADSAGGNGGERLAASPKARRLAQERGLELRAMHGSGPGGAVLAADLPEQGETPMPAAEPEPATGELESLSSAWRSMASRVTASWTSAPHFYLAREVRAGGLVELRARTAPAVLRRNGIKLTYSDLLVKLTAAALRDHPRLNASWSGDAIRRNPEINVGLAVGTEDGLVVPVIHAADRLSLGEIAARRQELVTRANGRRLRPEDLSGGTFTLSNLGMYHVDAFLAVLNPPQAAILAVGRIAERAVAENGQAVVRPMVTLTLSCDHRVTDGLRAAQFLDDLANLMEEPLGLIA